MKKFMLFLLEDLEKIDRMSPEELQKDIEAHTAWVEGLAKKGQFVSGEPLTSDARLVSANQLITDGPYMESKEAISGYFIIKADSIEAATQLAQSCPGVENGCKMLVRQIMSV